MLRKDSIWLGLGLGFVLPALLYFILTAGGILFESSTVLSRFLQGNKTMLVSLVINLVMIRIFFVNFKNDRTGRGILMATFILVLLFFILFKPI